MNQVLFYIELKSLFNVWSFCLTFVSFLNNQLSSFSVLEKFKYSKSVDSKVDMSEHKSVKIDRKNDLPSCTVQFQLFNFLLYIYMYIHIFLKYLISFLPSELTFCFLLFFIACLDVPPCFCSMQLTLSKGVCGTLQLLYP